MRTEDFFNEIKTGGGDYIYLPGLTPVIPAEVSADYTKVDEAIEKANALNKDSYRDFSGVEAAIAAVDRTKNITEQAEVDAMAQAIEDAINALERRRSSSGGGSSNTTYPVNIPENTDNGNITVSPKNASAGSTVTITVTPDSGYTIENVTADSYYYEAVKWAADNGITGGIGNNMFGPDNSCTRAQIVTFMWRAAGSPEPGDINSFSDVPADAYYAKAVSWAVEHNIASGTGNGMFSPDAVCTRAHAVTFLYRALGSAAGSSYTSAM